MMKVWFRRLLRLILIVVAILLGIGGFYLVQGAKILVGLKAKVLCSGVFLSGRDPTSILDEDLNLILLSGSFHKFGNVFYHAAF